MNAPIYSSNLTSQLPGVLLLAGWQQTDTLQLDLYGSRPTADDGHIVEAITAHGCTANIIELFTGTQLEKMGEYLDFEHDMCPVGKSIAARAKHEAMQGPWEKNRGLN
ncbi:hypothetical protein HF313_14975 [Massilia atriviolacea]|uniref:Uncharacterized protein n=1 Tax=Massilia atriviolacea TaxID=2495579 RepID=A0A430HR71_9BURK|nr:hypothetical protein [Massilia atriviolacea]RSZ60014.1 hypothetical protein EJB06_07495 [Massilia atriviolacea]